MSDTLTVSLYALMVSTEAETQGVFVTAFFHCLCTMSVFANEKFQLSQESVSSLNDGNQSEGNLLTQFVRQAEAVIESAENSLNVLRELTETFTASCKARLSKTTELEVERTCDISVANIVRENTDNSFAVDENTKQPSAISSENEDVSENIVHTVLPAESHEADLSIGSTEATPKKPFCAEGNDNIVFNESNSSVSGEQKAHAHKAETQKSLFDLSVGNRIGIIVGAVTFPLPFLSPLLWQLLMALMQAGANGLSSEQFLLLVGIWNEKYLQVENSRSEFGRQLQNNAIQRAISRLNKIFQRAGIPIHFRVENTNPTNKKWGESSDLRVYVIPGGKDKKTQKKEKRQSKPVIATSL